MIRASHPDITRIRQLCRTLRLGQGTSFERARLGTIISMPVIYSKHFAKGHRIHWSTAPGCRFRHLFIITVALSRSRDIASGISASGNPNVHATPQFDKGGVFYRTVVVHCLLPTISLTCLLGVGLFSLVVDPTMAQRHLTSYSCSCLHSSSRVLLYPFVFLQAIVLLPFMPS